MYTAMRYLAAASLMTTALGASALELGLYQQGLKADSRTVDLYVAGAFSGFSWANAQLQSDKQSPLFCQPSNLSLNPTNFHRLIADDVAKFEITDTKIDVTFILLKALKRAFPCK